MRLFQFFRSVILAPLMVLMSADAGGSAAAPSSASTALPAAPAPAPDAAPDASKPSNDQPTTAAPSQPSAAEVAQALMKALDERSQRTERSISKAIADKYGMTEDEINSILAAEKKKRDAALPAAVQRQLDAAMKAANDKLIAAEIRVQASALGFLDSGDALALIDRTGIKIDDKGEVTGVAEALKALAEKKPHLIKQDNGPGAWGQRHGTGAGGETTATDEIRAAMFGGGNK